MKTNNNFRILIVDDEKINIELVAAYLEEEGYQLSYATNAVSAIESVMNKDINLILLDINMPGKNGFDVCKILKSDDKTKDIPVIFLTGETDIDSIICAFEVGGVDYITKPFNGVELKARVKTHLQNVAYLEEIKHKQSKLAHLSVTDSLTKLHNSLYLDLQIKKYQKNGAKFWFIFFKIDRFEKINQIYGFYKANKILKSFANLLQKSIYLDATVARVYGANFGVLVDDCAQKTIEKLYKDIVADFIKDDSLANAVTFHTVMLYIKDTTVSTQTLYKKAQSNMQLIEQDEMKRFLFVE